MNNLFSKVRQLAWLGRLLLCGAGAVLIVVLGLTFMGFPDFLARWVLSGVSREDLYIHADKMYLDCGGGVDIRNVSMYRKGIPGPPFLETRELHVLYHFFERPKAGRSRVKELRAYNGVLRPLWSSTLPGHGRNGGTAEGILLKPSRDVVLDQAELDVTLNHFDVLGVWVEQVKAAVRVDADGVYLSRLSGKIGKDLHSGAIDGTLAWRREGRLTGRVSTSFDPRALMPVFKVYYPDAVGVLERFSFPTTPPRMDMTFEADSKPELSVVAKGRMQASNYAYRGAVIGFASINGDYVFGQGTNRLRMDPFSLTIGGRQARGQIEYDFTTGMSGFQISSEVNLSSVLRLIGLKEFLMAPWSFEEGTRLVAKGHVGYTHPEKSEVEAIIEGTKIGFKGITFNNYSLTYKNQGYSHRFSDVRANVGGGFASGSAVLVADKTGSHWISAIRAEIINADADEFLKLASTNLEWRMGGKVFGSFDAEGIGASPAGHGQLTIREARIFRSPLVASLLEKWGGLSRELDLAEIPVESRFSFELKNHRITSRDAVLEAGSFGLLVQGSCGLDGSLDWVVKPAETGNGSVAGRAVSAVLAPFHRGEYTLTGTLQNPEWRSLSKK